MSAKLAPQAKQKYTKNDGSPVPNGKLYTYKAGTTTNQATYKSPTIAATNAHPNPVSLDANGDAPAIYWSGNYKVVLKDAAGTVIWTVDNYSVTEPTATDVTTTVPAGSPWTNTQSFINKVTSSAGANHIGYKRAETNAVARTAQDKLGEFLSVKDFGAKGDGIKDDTAAIRAALQAAQNSTQIENTYDDKPTYWSGSSKILYFPSGVYKISDYISDNVVGKNPDGTSAAGGLTYLTIMGDNAMIVAPKGVIAFGGAAYQMRFSGLTFRGGDCAISIRTGNLDGSQIQIDHCEFHEQYFASIRTDNNSPSTIINIANCKFISQHNNNYVAFIESGDGVQFNNNWVEVIGPCAFHVNRSVLNMYGNLMVPLGNDTDGGMGPNGRWIDCYHSHIRAVGTRFGGEYSGCPIVYNYTDPQPFDYYEIYPYLGSTIVLEGCDVACGTDHQHTMIVAKKGLPSVIKVSGCYGATDSSIVGSPIGSEQQALSIWIDNYKAKGTGLPNLSISVTNNNFHNVTLASTSEITQKLSPYAVFETYNYANLADNHSTLFPKLEVNNITISDAAQIDHIISRKISTPHTTSTNKAIYNTGITTSTLLPGDNGTGQLYDVVYSGNPNADGSLNYVAVQAGMLIVGVGYDSATGKVVHQVFYKSTAVPDFMFNPEFSITAGFGSTLKPTAASDTEQTVFLSVTGFQSHAGHNGHFRLLRRL